MLKQEEICVTQDEVRKDITTLKKISHQYLKISIYLILIKYNTQKVKNINDQLFIIQEWEDLSWVKNKFEQECI